MAKIKNIELVKEKLEVGEIKASVVWEYDGQVGLKGNSVEAFEKDLARACKFKISKSGRDKVYVIEEVFNHLVNRIEHGNSVALKGNGNKKGCIGFNEGSRSKFIASVIINKIQYFQNNEGNEYKTIGQHMKSFGLYSEKHDQVNSIIRSSFVLALKKLEGLGYVNTKILYFKVVAGKSINIDKQEYDEIKEIEREEFKRIVTKEEFEIYKCTYNYSVYSKSLAKWSVLYKIKECCGVDYTYRRYLINTTGDRNLASDNKYCDLVLEVFEYFGGAYDINVQENISRFVEILESDYEENLKWKEVNKGEGRAIDMKVGFVE